MIPFVGPSYQLNTRKADVQRTLNMYVVVKEAPSGKTIIYLKSTPGLTVFSTGSIGLFLDYFDGTGLLSAHAPDIPSDILWSHTSGQTITLSGTGYVYPSGTIFVASNYRAIFLSSQTIDPVSGISLEMDFVMVGSVSGDIQTSIRATNALHDVSMVVSSLNTGVQWTDDNFNTHVFGVYAVTAGAHTLKFTLINTVGSYYIDGVLKETLVASFPFDTNIASHRLSLTAFTATATDCQVHRIEVNQL